MYKGPLPPTSNAGWRAAAVAEAAAEGTALCEITKGSTIHILSYMNCRYEL